MLRRWGLLQEEDKRHKGREEEGKFRFVIAPPEASCCKTSKQRRQQGDGEMATSDLLFFVFSKNRAPNRLLIRHSAYFSHPACAFG